MFTIDKFSNLRYNEELIMSDVKSFVPINDRSCYFHTDTTIYKYSKYEVKKICTTIAKIKDIYIIGDLVFIYRVLNQSMIKYSRRCEDHIIPSDIRDIKQINSECIMIDNIAYYKDDNKIKSAVIDDIDDYLFCPYPRYMRNKSITFIIDGCNKTISFSDMSLLYFGAYIIYDNIVCILTKPYTYSEYLYITHGDTIKSIGGYLVENEFDNEHIFLSMKYIIFMRNIDKPNKPMLISKFNLYE